MPVTDGHSLGEEAAAVVRQAVSLAARRGHTQVTPLHIASAMLSSPAPASILRAACIRSQSHPLQHNALDLALGGLAVTEAHHGGDPPPSNAFVAALKRAQARLCRRTGGAGGKVKLEKLVVSVLDDPSVDRVMRAAGFSSSQVRASVVASLEQSSRAGWDVAASSPNPFPDMIRAGRGPPSLPDGRYVLG
jgi:ATP-dependent Clp protease ATP-binding subunit ClpA